MTGFVVGLPSRQDAAAAERARLRAANTAGFTPAELMARIEEAFGAPRHFSPADPDASPTAGWDMMDPTVDTVDHAAEIEAAHSAGYEQGVADATAAAQANAERDRALLTTLAAELSGAARIDRETIAQQLRQTVLMLVERLVGEIGVSPERLVARVEAAAELLADEHESAMLRVHPDDVALLTETLPSTIFPVGDANVARGSFVLEAASTIVEDGPALWLEQLGQVIDRVALPSAR